MLKTYEQETTRHKTYPEPPRFIPFFSEYSAYLNLEVTSLQRRSNFTYKSQTGENLNTEINNFINYNFFFSARHNLTKHFPFYIAAYSHIIILCVF